MRTILFIIEKEFRQVFRNKTMLPIMFVLPIIQLLILVNAATFEMKNIKTYIVDNDQSYISRNLVNKFKSSPFFIIKGYSFSINVAEDKLRSDEIDFALIIPKGFERELKRNTTKQKANIQLIVNAINSRTAGLTNAYAQNILLDYNKDIIIDWYGISRNNEKQINITSSFWYNPVLNYKFYMLPGILVLLVTIIGMFLTAINLVREKELGTAEQINVTPIKKYQFLIAKLIPFLIIALFELAFGLLIGVVLFNLPIEGSLLLLFAFASVYLLVSLGLGLFISTLANNQQQVMFISFFFLIVFILMSGLFYPVESMPTWAQQINIINPFASFIRVIRMIILKGSGFVDIAKDFLHLFIYAICILSLSVWRYRKVA